MHQSNSQSETEHKYRPCIGYGGCFVCNFRCALVYVSIQFSVRIPQQECCCCCWLFFFFFSLAREKDWTKSNTISRAMGHIENCIVAALNIQQTDATEANTITKHLILFYFASEKQDNTSSKSFGVFCFHLNGFWLMVLVLLLLLLIQNMSYILCCELNEFKVVH